ncbi:MAG: nitrilase family protein [Dysgonamonadaceae bacterium]|jgi:predicted amidohydrolase|nr:nitrilase family protein [Dysgonamonadaceae bacterium]
MNELRICLVQSHLVWEDKPANLAHYGGLLRDIAGEADLVVLPEMYATGFVTKNLELAESEDGEIMTLARRWARDYGFAVCGSFLVRDASGKLYNRGFFITSEGEAYFADKRHLFRMGEENLNFTAGDKIYPIIRYKGWNIRLIVCYDLRFPVWCRNRDNEYDLLVCTANWPLFRIDTWDTLLKARALENECYVCGVSRVGDDGLGYPHPGHSVVVDFRGKIIARAEDDRTSVVTCEIRKAALDTFRRKFPAWLDADDFRIL